MTEQGRLAAIVSADLGTTHEELIVTRRELPVSMLLCRAKKVFA